MKNTVELEKLAVLLKKKRGKRGLREVATEIGKVSASTLSRVENANMPDMETFLLLCDWLQIPASQLIESTNDFQDLSDNSQDLPEVGLADKIAIQLRADKNLDVETANALATLVRAAYGQSKGK